MADALPFAFHTPQTQTQYEKHTPPYLLKLKPGRAVSVFFGLTVHSKLILPLHWDHERGKSRVCQGDDRCADCDLGYRRQFHLYAAVYVQEEVESRAIVDLGTSMAVRWQAKMPDFNMMFSLYRKDVYGPILAECKNAYSLFKNTRPGWDIRPDIDKLFKGRISPQRMEL